MTKTKRIISWCIAILVMAFVLVFQFKTGPTYPQKGKYEIGNSSINYNFPRSHAGDGHQNISIEAPDPTTKGRLHYKRFKSKDDWTSLLMVRDGKVLSSEIPHQPPAGKVMYQVFLSDSNNSFNPVTKEPIVIRFRGDVPIIIVALHLFFLFATIMLSTRAGLEAAFGGERVLVFSLLTTISLLIGGIIVGPIMQKYAFNAFWTGWPYGHDLTDNKTIVAFIVWLISLWRIWKNPASKKWAIIASVALLAVFLIPHSMLGSELDYSNSPAATTP